MAGRVLDRWRTEGTFGTLRWLAYRAAQRVMVLEVDRVVWLDSASSARFAAPAGCSFRFLTPEETDAYARDPASDLEPELAARMRAGRDFCYAAICGGQLAAYAWFALGSIEAEHNRGHDPRAGVAMSFPPDVTYAYKGYARPEFRGRGLFSACIAKGLAELRSRGVEHLLWIADWTNRDSLNSLYRLGSRDVGTIACVVLMGRAYAVVPSAARRRGVRFGKHAIVASR